MGAGSMRGAEALVAEYPYPASSSAPREEEGCPAGGLTLWSTFLAIKGPGWGGGFFGPALPPPPGPAPRKAAFLCRLRLLGGLLPGRALVGGQPLSQVIPPCQRHQLSIAELIYCFLSAHSCASFSVCSAPGQGSRVPLIGSPTPSSLPEGAES